VPVSAALGVMKRQWPLITAGFLLASIAQASQCSAPPLSEADVLAVFHAEAERRGGKLDMTKWQVRIRPKECTYLVSASIPDQRGADFGMLIDRQKKVLKYYKGR